MNPSSNPKHYDCIIIGAGAAGLMAARELVNEGVSVCVVEAQSIAGGRILTINEPGFQHPVEAGAEFVHGKLPLTLKLLTEAKIDYQVIKGEMINVRHKNWLNIEQRDEHWSQFMRQVSKQKEDITLELFLDQYFPSPEFDTLRHAVQGFAEGFDLADISKVSTSHIQSEWTHEDDRQFRIPGGYGELINWLESECLKGNAEIFFNTRINKIEYSKNPVTIHSTDQRQFSASAAIITVPLGILQSKEISFEPQLQSHGEAIKQLEFGTVIKFLFQFDSPFWEDQNKNAAFFLSDEIIPTWWTQSPVKSNLLTGWIGGPGAFERSSDSEETLLSTAIQSIANIFSLSNEIIRTKLTHYRIFSWQNLPNIRGGYSYNNVYSSAAKKILAMPVDSALFFAGEAMDEGESIGTVESALESGVSVATRVKELLKKMA